jgi:hypothetical protein
VLYWVYPNNSRRGDHAGAQRSACDATIAEVAFCGKADAEGSDPALAYDQHTNEPLDVRQDEGLGSGEFEIQG